MPKPKSFRYSLNQKIRRAVKCIMRLITTRSKGKWIDLHKETIDRILLVRATFRMGDSVLATPAIFLFRKRFPGAKIDFVGGPISKKLFQNVPIDEHFCITRRFPDSSWAYLALLKRLRSARYDLAVDLSCSQSALGAFIVGFSKARFRVGLRGEWDRWFNVRIPRPPVKNKYKVLPAFLSAFGLEADEVLPGIALSASEREEGRNRIESITRHAGSPVVGVFIGGRQTWSKRWPIENFCQLITILHWQGKNVVTFFGPEEKRLMECFSDALEPEITLIYEPSPRKFAGLVANCDLFITCDSGPMHLAYAVDTRIIAIFQNQNFDHWGPPSSIARIVHEPGGCSVEAVLKACELEVSSYVASVPDFPAEHSSLLTSSPKINRVVRRLEKSRVVHKLRFLSRWAQATFFLGLVMYALFMPPSGVFKDGTWAEIFNNSVGIVILLTGIFLRAWATSHGGKPGQLNRTTTPKLITTGPYTYIRHPLYVSSLCIALGFIFPVEAFPLIPILIVLVAVHHLLIIPTEEEFLREKLGETFDLYCSSVPKYVPEAIPTGNLSFGKYFHLKQVGTALILILANFGFEWLDSPLHRQWLIRVYNLVVR